MHETWIPNRGTTGSTLTHLEGGLSKRTYAADALTGLDPADGKPLLARYDLEQAATTLTVEAMDRRQTGGLWRWHEILPVQAWKHALSLGEGSTPLLPAQRLGRHYGAPNLLMKSESLNPTGSFKARGMAVAVSRAVELGAACLVVPSAGNAGGALAAYAAVAGVPAIVVMPADAPIANQIEVLVTSAKLILLDGLITDCGRLARLIATELNAWDISTLREPYRVEGKKTMGLELAEDLGWRFPDAVIYPTGGGTGLIGMWKAFHELKQMGLVNGERPRMYSVQPEGCAPIVKAFAASKQFATPWENATTAAAGLRVPAAIGDFLVLECLRDSGGGALAVPESDLASTQRRIASLGCGYLSLETAAAVAAVPQLLADGRLDPKDLVVVLDTGAGFKSELGARLEFPAPISNEPQRWDGVVDQLRNTAGYIRKASSRT